MKKLFIIIFLANSLFAFSQSEFSVSKSGLLYKIIKAENATVPVEMGNIVKYSTVQKFGDSISRNSEESGNSFAKIDSIDQPFAETEVIKMMHVGDSAFVKISCDSIYHFIYNQASTQPNFSVESFEKSIPSFFLNKENYVTVGFRVLKKYATDSLAMIDFELEKPKMEAYQQKMMAKQMADLKEKAKATKLAGAKFLASNKTKPGVKTTASGLQYKIIKLGTGVKPTVYDQVVCHYAGTLLNGVEFDNSYKRGEPATFAVTGVIKSWTEVLQLMPTGTKVKIWAPSDIAYGDQGSPPVIGPGETLIFDIELQKVIKGAAPKIKVTPPVNKKPVAKPKAPIKKKN